MSNLSIYEKVFAENGMMWMDITASNVRIALVRWSIKGSLQVDE